MHQQQHELFYEDISTLMNTTACTYIIMEDFKAKLNKQQGTMEGKLGKFNFDDRNEEI